MLTRTLTVLLVVALAGLVACTKYIPEEPPQSTGAVFQRSPEEVRAAARNALTKLNFAIIQENDEYIEAVHLKPGETVEKNRSELVGVWIKPRDNSVLLLVDTVKRASGIAKQRDWRQDLTRLIIKEL